MGGNESGQYIKKLFVYVNLLHLHMIFIRKTSFGILPWLPKVYHFRGLEEH